MGTDYNFEIEVLFYEHDDEREFVKELRNKLNAIAKNHSAKFSIEWQELYEYACEEIPQPEIIESPEDE
jgi:hypothetical protein